MSVVHWDEVEGDRAERGPLRSTVTDLGSPAGSVTVGVTRWQVDPGGRSTPVHVELAEEEIFYVLGGSGLVWLNGRTHEVGPDDCVVCLAAEDEHTFVAGPDGLDLLAFGMRAYPTGTLLPRAGIVRMDPAWVEAYDKTTPWEREAAAGELELPGPSARPGRIVNVADAPEDDGWHELGRSAGSQLTGLNHVRVEPGKLNCPPHCHSAEEEIFVVLEGGGDLELLPSPARRGGGAEPERHAVRRGSVVARPAGTGIAHAFRGGAEGLTLLAYGTRDRRDVAYYPRSNKIFFRGVGVMARLEHLEYEEGEPDE